MFEIWSVIRSLKISFSKYCAMNSIATIKSALFHLTFPLPIQYTPMRLVNVPCGFILGWTNKQNENHFRNSRILLFNFNFNYFCHNRVGYNVSSSANSNCLFYINSVISDVFQYCYTGIEMFDKSIFNMCLQSFGSVTERIQLNVSH